MTTTTSFTIQLLLRQLHHLSGVLKKAEEWCDKNGKEHSFILEAKLAPNMMPLPYQVRVCTSMGTNALLGPSWSYEGSGAKPEDERDFASLQTRIQRTIATLTEFDQKIMVSHIDDKVSVNPSGKPGGKAFDFKDGPTYLLEWDIPDFFFHASMTYAICRMQGVPLIKLDFIGYTFTA